MRRIWTNLGLASISLCLSACGGGTFVLAGLPPAPTATVTPTPTPTPTPPPTGTASVFTETVSNRTVVTGLRGHPTTIVATADASPAGFTADWTFTTPGGTVHAASGGSNTFSVGRPRLRTGNVLSGGYTLTSSTDAAVSTTDGGSLEDFRMAVPLQYTSFGTWGLSRYGGTYGGAQPGVALTATVPTVGSATFSGLAVGYVYQPVAATSVNTSEFRGYIGLTANFATGAVTGGIGGIEAIQGGPGPIGGQSPIYGTINDIGLSATISGSSFTGIGGASVTGSAGTAFDITGATGNVYGGFYGPSGVETAGVFDLSGGPNSTTLVGSFGAKQPAPSDRRLKEEIVPLTTLPNGLKLYSWRYLGGHRRFTGVMAQDLLTDSRFAGAVEADASGLMRVDYGRIGFIPADFGEMLVEGEHAIAVYRRTYH